MDFVPCQTLLTKASREIAADQVDEELAVGRIFAKLRVSLLVCLNSV
jgi:hypothetical protein